MMTNPERHPDIEIYLKGQPLAAIEAWLKQRLGPLRKLRSGSHGTGYEIEHNGQTIPVLIIEKAAGSFNSVWFDSPDTPWSQDIDCAREAAAQLQCETRCIAAGWQEGDEPDEWWSVSPEGEKKILWRG